MTVVSGELLDVGQREPVGLARRRGVTETDGGALAFGIVKAGCQQELLGAPCSAAASPSSISAWGRVQIGKDPPMVGPGRANRRRCY
jgi:hypothetical protein